MSNKSVTKEITYSDLTVEEAIELINKVKGSKEVFRGIGNEIIDRKRPGWLVSVSMKEMALVDLVSNPNPIK
jgi:hypothetical protein